MTSSIDATIKSPASCPDVIHIGFSKCASTYLRSLFRSHPQVHLVFKSGMFTPFLQHKLTISEYLQLFSDDPAKVNVESDEHLTLPGIHPSLGVRTTDLTSFGAVVSRIRWHLPDVKILMVIRNQASLLISRYSEFMIQGGSLSFEEFVDQLMGSDRGPNLYFQNYYYQLISILNSTFPPDQILVLMQEDMKHENGTSFKAIADFLGLNESFVLQAGFLRQRQSLSIAGLSALRYLNSRLVLSPSYGGSPVSARVPQWLYDNAIKAVRALDYFVLRHISEPASTLLTESRRESILAHFREDNLKLQTYFGKDLVSYGYLS